MDRHLKKLLFLSWICTFAVFNFVKAETSDIKEILEIIQKDLRTLERAVYSESFSKSSKSSSNNISSNVDTEEVLTRHLLKLSEIEKQFLNLTNKYEHPEYILRFNDVDDRDQLNINENWYNNYVLFDKLNNEQKEELIMSSGLNNLEYTVIERKNIHEIVELIKVDI